MLALPVLDLGATGVGLDRESLKLGPRDPSPTPKGSSVITTVEHAGPGVILMLGRSAATLSHARIPSERGSRHGIRIATLDQAFCATGQDRNRLTGPGPQTDMIFAGCEI